METPELPSWSRTYAGYRERFVLPFVVHLNSSQHITLEQCPCVSAEHARESKASADGSCTASTVWDAGVVLAMHIFGRAGPSGTNSDSCYRCLDLGSGTGIVGLAAAAGGEFRRVVLSDLPTVVPLLERTSYG